MVDRITPWYANDLITIKINDLLFSSGHITGYWYKVELSLVTYFDYTNVTIIASAVIFSSL